MPYTNYDKSKTAPAARVIGGSRSGSRSALRRERRTGPSGREVAADLAALVRKGLLDAVSGPDGELRFAVAERQLGDDLPTTNEET